MLLILQLSLTVMVIKLQALEQVMVKFAAEESQVLELKRERRMLRQLAGAEGFPRLIDEGEIVVSGVDHELKLQPWVTPYFVMPLISGNNLEFHSLNKWQEQRPGRERRVHRAGTVGHGFDQREFRGWPRQRFELHRCHRMRDLAGQRQVGPERT